MGSCVHTHVPTCPPSVSARPSEHEGHLAAAAVGHRCVGLGAFQAKLNISMRCLSLPAADSIHPVFRHKADGRGEQFNGRADGLCV